MAWTEGDVIRKLRLIYGCTLKELAETSKISLTTISKLELGKTRDPKRESLRRIAEAFGLTVAQLVSAIPAHPIAVPEGKAVLRRLTHEALREIPRLSKQKRQSQKRQG